MRVSEIDVINPNSVMECLDILGKNNGDYRLIAGGTDAVVRMKDGKWRPTVWINIKDIDSLRFINMIDNEIHIGPLTTHSDLIKSPVLNKHADLIVEAARQVGATQIQNMGTIGGNMGTASPAGDLIPPLFVLSARLELSSLSGKRIIPIEEFFIGPGKTVMLPNEMITKIIITPQKENEIGIFEKLGPRKAQAISIVNVACSLQMDQNRKCIGGKIAFGSVAPTVIRAKKCEAMLTLADLDENMIENIGEVAWKEVMPISDIRASAIYRRDMAKALLKRGLFRLMKRWEEA
ncbi:MULTISPECIES: xanthine dehydrogenase family protein subunit M [unclassified Bacillus (in: firmicutes)]|uniref:FAD binding domain-containing protein n=1 Tax=unclassified Bacillus (in: firmicutes) TaxID=185979 RepID=UPI0008EACD1E|nr:MULTISPECIES: xanthine dehydrogenase family protein subunit M [unclassified Bacillus (in: firmicutes)]SFB02354.1 carbon-monoxide dehydrogenase medium subunit [Bacillus sp. UNCCL13]SFQ89107.1 carbon-monoxide dehydrogenase medium subunit [Bacillus sp. cl95]